jgi:Cu+-exporting ATPase
MKKLAILLIVFAFVSCQSNKKETATKDEAVQMVQVVETTINISGMHCANCVASVEKGVTALEGVESVAVSLNDSSAIVKFDPAQLELNEIEKAIEKRGYAVKK